MMLSCFLVYYFPSVEYIKSSSIHIAITIFLLYLKKIEGNFMQNLSKFLTKWISKIAINIQKWGWTGLLPLLIRLSNLSYRSSSSASNAWMDELYWSL